MTEESFDFLKILSKTEIIEFLKAHYYYKVPSEREIIFFKWSRTANKLQKEMDEHLINIKNSTHAKEADKLAVEFNKETDHNKKFEILKKREKHLISIQSEHKEWDKINKKQMQNDKLYGGLDYE